MAGTHAFFGALLFRLIALTGVALMVVYLPRLAHAHGIDPPKAVWLALLNPLVLMHFVAGAHNDALMVGLMVAGLTLAVERHPIIGIAADRPGRSREADRAGGPALRRPALGRHAGQLGRSGSGRGSEPRRSSWPCSPCCPWRWAWAWAGWPP